MCFIKMTDTSKLQICDFNDFINVINKKTLKKHCIQMVITGWNFIRKLP